MTLGHLFAAPDKHVVKIAAGACMCEISAATVAKSGGIAQAKAVRSAIP